MYKLGNYILTTEKGANNGVAQLDANGKLLTSQVTLANVTIDSDVIITDSRGTKKGLEYADDYSADFTARSLVDKAYVDANSGGNTVYTADGTILSNRVLTLTDNVTFKDGVFKIQGAGTSTGTTLALYDNDSTPAKTWEFLDNGNANIKDGSIVFGRLGISKASASVSTNALFALTVIGETADATKGILSCRDSGGTDLFKVSCDGKVYIEDDTTIDTGTLNIGSANLQGVFRMGVRDNVPLVLRKANDDKISSFAHDGIRHTVKSSFGLDASPAAMVDVTGHSTSGNDSAVKIANSGSTLYWDFRNNGTLIGSNGARIKEVLVNPTVQEAANSATFTINSDQETDGVLTAMSANTTIAAPTGTPVQSQSLVFRFKDDGSARTLTWNAIFRAIGVTLPTTTTASKLLYVGCKYNSTDTKWDVVSVQEES